jgi:hypothetical protein
LFSTFFEPSPAPGGYEPNELPLLSFDWSAKI